MNGTGRRLALLGTLLLVVMLAGAGVAIAQGWPAQFSGGGNPRDVRNEALTRGTAMSPPLAPVVVFVLALLAALRRGRTGTVGCAVLVLVSVVFIIGGVGEALAGPTPDVPRPALVVSGLLAAVLGSLVIVAAVARLRRLRQ